MSNLRDPYKHLLGWWKNIDDGWQAVLLGGVALLAVMIGVPIPW
jgi:hypothetical protein